MLKSRNLAEIAKKSQNDQNDQSDPKTTKTTKATRWKILRPEDSENDQFGRKRPKMATLQNCELSVKKEFNNNLMYGDLRNFSICLIAQPLAFVA